MSYAFFLYFCVLLFFLYFLCFLYLLLYFHSFFTHFLKTFLCSRVRSVLQSNVLIRLILFRLTFPLPLRLLTPLIIKHQSYVISKFALWVWRRQGQLNLGVAFKNCVKSLTGCVIVKGKQSIPIKLFTKYASLL